jgi:hypothetical protein
MHCTESQPGFLRANAQLLWITPPLYALAALSAGRLEVLSLLFGREVFHQTLHELEHHASTGLLVRTGPLFGIVGLLAMAAGIFLMGGMLTEQSLLNWGFVCTLIMLLTASLYSKSFHASQPDHFDPRWSSHWWKVTGAAGTILGALAFRLWA